MRLNLAGVLLSRWHGGFVWQNKKQRMMVRAAVLKMKDPRQIIRDMEKLDEMGERRNLLQLILFNIVE